MDQNWCKHRNMFGNSHGNFQLHRFTTSENIANVLGGLLFFDSHCTCVANLHRWVLASSVFRAPH